MQSQTISVVIKQPFEDVYGFLVDPRNFASWGPVSDVDIHFVHGSDWLVHLPRGPMIIRFTEPNLYGVLDYTIFGAGQQPGPPTPSRLVRLGDGECELLLTWRRQPGTDDARFEAEIAGVESYLNRLKALLEADPAH